MSVLSGIVSRSEERDRAEVPSQPHPEGRGKAGPAEALKGRTLVQSPLEAGRVARQREERWGSFRLCACTYLGIGVSRPETAVVQLRAGCSRQTVDEAEGQKH